MSFALTLLSIKYCHNRFPFCYFERKEEQSKHPSGHQRLFQHVRMDCFCFFMVAGVVLVQIIKWEEKMLCDILNNERLLYGYVILNLSKDLHEKDIVAVV